MIKKTQNRRFGRCMAAMIMAGCTMLGVLFNSFATPSSRIDDFSYSGMTLEESFSLGQSGDYSDLIVSPGDEIRIPLTADMFTFTDGKVPINREALQLSQLSRVQVGTQSRAGSRVLDYVQFDVDTFRGQPFISGVRRTGRTAYISVMFARELPRQEDEDFEFTIQLSIDKKTNEALYITLAGTMVADIEYIDGDYTDIDISNGTTVEPLNYIVDATVDIGHGIQLVTNLTEGRRYYGTVKILEGRSAYLEELDLVRIDEDLPGLYDDIVCIYQLRTSGFNNVKHVKFSKIQGLHVYNEQMEYLGTTEDELAFSRYYFLANERMPQLEPIALRVKSPDDTLVEDELSEKNQPRTHRPRNHWSDDAEFFDMFYR